MLVKLKDWLELDDRHLTFRLQEPFLMFAEGKKLMEQELGSLEPLNCRLSELKSDVLERIVPVWSRFGDSNPGPTAYKAVALPLS
jgi:hypothetical protein